MKAPLKLNFWRPETENDAAYRKAKKQTNERDWLIAGNNFIVKNTTINQSEKGKIIVPEMFLEHIAAVTTGTSRGILFAKTEKTPFNNFILPPLNVKELVQSDGIFEIE